MIYVIVELETANCKVGYSRNPDKRLRELQTGNPNTLSILCTLEGDKPDERMIHDKWKDVHMKGEWFSYNEKFVDWLYSPTGYRYERQQKLW